MLHTAVEHFRRHCRAEEASEQQNGSRNLPHIITCNVEHDSVKLAAEHLQREGRAGGTSCFLQRQRSFLLTDAGFALLPPQM